MWTKTVITGIITGIVGIAKAIGDGTGSFEIPNGTVESLLSLMGIFLRFGISKGATDGDNKNT